MGKGLRRKRGEINDLNRELGGGGKILGRKGRRSGAKRPLGGKGRNDLNRERGGKDLREEREKIWGKKANMERGEKIFRGGKALGGKGGK